MSALNGPVPMLALGAEYAELEGEWFAALRETGRRGSFVLGPQVAAFEREVADYLGVPHAVGLANGTDALELSLRALDVGPGDEVITTPFTFFATAEVISRVGARPVFVDIEADSFNLDLDQVADAIGPRTRAVLPVHLFGHPVDMEALTALAGARGVAVVEDCAQAFGARWGERPVGGFGDTGCFSFYPTKVLGGYGDGGLLVSRDADLVARVRRLRNHGAEGPFLHAEVGCNSRLDEVQAALLRLKLRRIEQALAGRARVAAAYDAGLAGLPLTLPARPAGGRHAFNLYTLRSPHRERIRAALVQAGIGHAVCYPAPLHRQAVYAALGYGPGSLPVSERLAEEVISLPIYPELADAQVERVCRVIRAALA